jgi:hypothetical protein
MLRIIYHLPSSDRIEDTESYVEGIKAESLLKSRGINVICIVDYYNKS